MSARRHAGLLPFLAVATAAASCIPGPIVAPLRYEPPALAADQAFRAQPPESAPVVPAASLPWRVTTLAGGLRVAHLERHGLPIVSLRLVMARGAADASAMGDTYGILRDLLDAGTAARTGVELSAAYAQLGAQHQVFFGPDGCGLAAKVGAADLDAATAILAEAATRPRLQPRELADVRRRWAQSFANGGGNPEAMMRRNALVTLFGKWHAYGFVRPATWHVDALRVEDLAALHTQLFQPSQATLVVVGDATPEAVDASAARWFGGWGGGVPAIPRAPAPPPPDPARVILVEQSDTAQTQVAVLARGPAAADGDTFALEVLARALGGLSSTLREEVRDETGAAYGFGAVLVRLRTASFVTLGGPLDRDKAVPAVRAMVAALRDARERGVGEAALGRARASLLAEWRTRSATTEGLAAMAGTAMASGLGLEVIAGYPARIQAVTEADVRRVAARYCGDDAIRVVVLGHALVRAGFAGLGLGTVAYRNGFGEDVYH